MKRIFTLSLLLFVLTFTSKLSAQFTEADIKFWVGEGPHTAVLVIDFRDGTTDPSFAFGFRYDQTEDLTFNDMIQAVVAEEPKLSTLVQGGFLSDVIYNGHSGIAGEPDWWSTWSGGSLETIGMNGGVSETLSDGGWYGLSYGFFPEALAPTVTYPAYSSAWFAKEDVDFWVGTGTNESVIVIDFNIVAGDVVTYAWGIKYNGTITKEQALNLIDAADSNLQVSISTDQINTITYGSLVGNQNGDYWSTFKGTNMSDWVMSEGLSGTLENGDWFGVTYGNDAARRPFKPTAAQDNQMGTINHNESHFKVYPNPAVSIVNIKSDFEIQKTEVINVTGQVVKSFTQTSTLNLSDLNQGVYFVKAYSEKGSSVQKMIKK